MAKRALAVFIAALAVRACYVAFRAPSDDQAFQEDAVGYDGFARSLLTTGRYEFQGTRATRVPGYPTLLAGVYAVFGRSASAVRWFQCLIGAAACALLFLALSHPLGERLALGTALVGCIFLDWIWPTVLVYSDVAFTLPLTAALWAWFALPPSWRRSAAVGLSLGAAALFRPEAVLWAFVLGLFELGRALRPYSRPRLARALLLGAAFWVVAGPWWVRDRAVLGRWVPGSSLGAYYRYTALALALDNWGRPPVRPSAEPEKEPEAWSHAYGDLTARLGRATVAKAYAFNVASIFYPFLPGYDFTFMLILPWLLAGAWWAARDGGGFAPWAFAWTAVVLLQAYTSGPQSRMRTGWLPVSLALAGFGWSEFQKRRPDAEKLGAAWAGLNAAIWAGGPHVRSAILAAKSAVLGGTLTLR
jgi:hypothetical protein